MTDLAPELSVPSSHPAQWLRVALPAVFIASQSTVFLFFFRDVLGGMTEPFIPHLTLSVLLIASIYGLAVIVSVLIHWHILRALLLSTLGLSAVVTTSVYYLTATFTLYGFRDLPTRGVVMGYFHQIPAMLNSLPISKVTLASLCVTTLLILLAASAGIAWCLGGIRSRISKPNGLKIRPSIALTPLVALLLLVLVPPVGFIKQFEPWLRSLYNRPLSESGLDLQANPVEEARDQQLESAFPTRSMGSRANVVLIYIDGLRADVLTPYGGGIQNMPFMASLVNDGKIQQFPRTFATCSMTLCGLGSLLQSRPAHRISPGNFSLPKVLHKQGYDTRYLLSGDHQHFLALKQYYGPTQDFYMDGYDLDPARSNDDLFVYEQLHRLPSALGAQRPQFIMFGLMSVHIWGTRHKEFRKWLPDKLNSTSFSNLDDNSVIAYRNNYMNGVLQADYVLSKIWQWLDFAGYLETSIIVITSDHGESLGENGQLGHARSLHTPELLVPLWIHTPAGKIPTRNPVFQDDIAPTILDLLGLPIPDSWTGDSLLKPAPNPRWLPLYYINNKDKFGLILTRDGRTLKYLVDARAHSENVYDLDNDLFEQDDILSDLPTEVVDGFRLELQASFGTIISPTHIPHQHQSKIRLEIEMD